ncbi:OmpA family protein [Piscinibacter sp. HJYY11]|uniref:OmpA family protein n=1 Tax=Piscinibacter sp. HJYY11 TaxID=2801333 RepID=UPI00191F97AB|nr:OmpA family protein [Piscinibacter sp. HJYY11]MBL0726466.1 OmpA family protein [Piscinibacter sp. HJYY11]
MNARFLASPIAAAVLMACATAPVPSSSLEQARLRVKAAQADSRIAAHAPMELKRAEQALQLTEKTWAADGSPAIVDHHAYITGQRVTLAQETAASLADQAVTTNAAAERDRTRLSARTAEADTATRERNEAERASATKSSELAAAEQRSMRKDQELGEQKSRVNDLESLLADLNAKKTDRGLVVTLGDVLFDTGSSALREGSSRQLRKLAEVLQDASRSASIEGFTDNVGSESSNRELSGRRATAVATALTSLGVPAARLRTASRGEDSPVADNGTALGRQMNRRVEMIISQDRP